jgi:hypothetical protein
MGALGRLQQASLAEICLRPVDTIGKRRLLAAWQKLLSFFFRQLEIVCQ